LLHSLNEPRALQSSGVSNRTELNLTKTMHPDERGIQPLEIK